MLVTLEVVTVVLAAIALVPALAHALELPGKLRLGRQEYLAVQPIYYPGFTIAGIAEPLVIVATLALLVATRASPAFGLIAVALAALLAMQAIFWIVTQPVNRFWLRDTDLSHVGKRFFGTGGENTAATPDWSAARDRWEWSHVARAAVALVAFMLLVIAVAV